MPLVKTPTIALVGNPNTGKTTLFNALSGLRQRVGNYPGVTVETKKGQFRHRERTVDVIDLPGTYSLSARSPDEMVAVDVILGHQQNEARPDVVVTIVDASNLERNLYLSTQVLELNVPVIVALNMMDVAKSSGIQIDVARLSQNLGVPVVPIQANRGLGIAELKDAIVQALDSAQPPQKTPTFPPVFEEEIANLSKALGDSVEPFLLRRLLIDVNGQTEKRLLHQKNGELQSALQSARQRLIEANCSVPAVEARTRYGWIREVTTDCLQRSNSQETTWSDRIDRVLTHRIFGTLIFLLMMFLVFYSIFVLAKPLMDWIDMGVGFVADLVASSLPDGTLRSLLVDGVIAGVGGVIIFIPQIIILFAFIAILEDCGYMSRAAFLMDKLMARCGLSGKSFIPMLSSVACAIPGIMAARVVENPRDRLATILVAPLMSCSARLPVYLLFTAAFLGPQQGYPAWVSALTIFAMYLIGIVVAPLVALVLKRTMLRGETPAFVMEMPSYKWPSLATVSHRMGESGWAFVRRAGTIILASMIVVWALLYFPSTDAEGVSYPDTIAKLEESIAEEQEQLAELGEEDLSEADTKRRDELLAKVEPVIDQINSVNREWKTNSILGQMGKAIAPAVRPLGWDWRIGMAAIASFPAREVFVGTMGIIYNEGDVDPGDEVSRTKLGDRLREITWDDEPTMPVFTTPVAISIMVFFALCAQCASTLAIIRRETNSWGWPLFTFVYMTVLAYVGALLVYQIGSLLGA